MPMSSYNDPEMVLR